MDIISLLLLEEHEREKGEKREANGNKNDWTNSLSLAFSFRISDVEMFVLKPRQSGSHFQRTRGPAAS